MKRHKKSWRDWVSPQRAVPLATAILAFVAIAAATFDLLRLSIPEQLLLTILGLLAVDALVERMGILEQIRHSLDILSRGAEFQPSLMWERDLIAEVTLDKDLQGANELFVSGGSLVGLLSRQRELIRRWLSQTIDAKLLLILEDPEAARRGKTPVWSSDIDRGREAYAQDIERSLTIIMSLKEKFPEKIEARLTDQVPSLTIMMIDRSKARVFLNLYMGGPEKRPVFELSKTRHPEWFGLFKERYYDQLWNESRPWPPAGGDTTNSPAPI